MKHVAIYTGVSTDEQKSDMQLLDLKEYAAKQRHGHGVCSFNL